MSLKDQPHYEVTTSDLADWVQRQGKDTWWTVDGDPILEGRVLLPCKPADLAAVLKRIDRTLLVRDKKKESSAKGQRVSIDKLDELVERFAENMHQLAKGGPRPEWADDRFLWLSWKGSDDEWMLAEDHVAADYYRGLEEDSLAKAD